MIVCGVSPDPTLGGGIPPLLIPHQEAVLAESKIVRLVRPPSCCILLSAESHLVQHHPDLWPALPVPLLWGPVLVSPINSTFKVVTRLRGDTGSLFNNLDLGADTLLTLKQGRVKETPGSKKVTFYSFPAVDLLRNLFKCPAFTSTVDSSTGQSSSFEQRPISPKPECLVPKVLCGPASLSVVAA